MYSENYNEKMRGIERDRDKEGEWKEWRHLISGEKGEKISEILKCNR